MLRTRGEVFKAYDKKKIDKSALLKFFDAAQKGDRDVRAMSFAFLLRNSHRFSSVFPFTLKAFSKEKDYNVRTVIMAGLALWNKKSSLAKEGEKNFLMPSEEQLLEMMALAEKEFSASQRLDSKIASVALMESILHFGATKKDKMPQFGTLSSKIGRECGRVAQNHRDKLFIQALNCLKVAREKNVVVKIPVFSHPVKQFFVERYLNSSIVLK